MRYSVLDRQALSLTRWSLLIAMAISLASPTNSLADAGDLDTAFGNQGKVTTDLVRQATMNDLAIQADGKIIAVGGTILQNEDIHSRNVDRSFYCVVRYNPDGTLDPSFNDDGKFLVGFTRAGPDQTAVAVAIQPDGKIVFVGAGAPTSLPSITVFRLNTDGTLDSTFSNRFGYKIVADPDTVLDPADIAVQPDGKILLAGAANNNPIIVRLLPDGSYDTSFDGDGIARQNLGRAAGPTAISIQGDGRILITGRVARFDPGDFADLFIARYTTSGSPDTAFGIDGWSIVSWGSTELPVGMALRSDGKPVVAAITTTSSIFADSTLLTRFNTDGTLDFSFGDSGRVVHTGATPRDMAIDANGRIIIAANPDVYASLTFGALRFKHDGSLDPSFSGDGVVSTQFSPPPAIASAGCVAIQQDQKIVVGGHNGALSQGDFAVARYLGQ